MSTKSAGSTVPVTYIDPQSIAWFSVQSSNVSKLALLSDNRLATEFIGGVQYIYEGDHSENFSLLMQENSIVEQSGGQIGSVGHLFNNLIKRGGYPYSRLNVESNGG